VPAFAAPLPDKETLAERYTNGSKAEQVQVEWPNVHNLLDMVVVVRPNSGCVARRDDGRRRRRRRGADPAPARARARGLSPGSGRTARFVFP
jgi:hypothetical protein